jgi:hypothetical protein
MTLACRNKTFPVKSRLLDNIFIERLWCSMKDGCVYLHVWANRIEDDGWHQKSGWGSTIVNALILPLAESHQPWFVDWEKKHPTPNSKSKE